MNGDQVLRTILKTGASVFGASAVLLVVLPDQFLMLMGLDPQGITQWAMRMIGITLIALTGNMLAVATRGTGGTVRFSARVMQVSAFLLGVVTLTLPAPLNWFTILYSVVGFGFSLAYTVALAKKS